MQATGARVVRRAARRPVRGGASGCLRRRRAAVRSAPWSPPAPSSPPGWPPATTAPSPRCSTSSGRPSMRPRCRSSATAAGAGRRPGRVRRPLVPSAALRRDARQPADLPDACAPGTARWTSSAASCAGPAGRSGTRACSRRRGRRPPARRSPTPTPPRPCAPRCAALPPDQRQVVELAYFGGLSYRDVARRMGIPEGTAKSRVRLALAKLETAAGPPAAGAVMTVDAGAAARGPARPRAGGRPRGPRRRARALPDRPGDLPRRGVQPGGGRLLRPARRPRRPTPGAPRSCATSTSRAWSGISPGWRTTCSGRWPAIRTSPAPTTSRRPSRPPSGRRGGRRTDTRREWRAAAERTLADGARRGPRRGRRACTACGCRCGALLVVRAFELWTHENDIRRVAGLPASVPDAGRRCG